MKKKVIEGFMKSTCAVVSAACLVTSIPVSAASISENDVYETNVENDQSIESDNSEETLENTDSETEDDQTKSVEKVVENKSETDLASYFTLDYASMTADEFNEAVQDLSMEDLWLVMSAQSNEVISYLLSLEGCILGDSRTVYIIDKETEELKDTIEYDTTYEYLKDTFDKTKFVDQKTVTTQVVITFTYEGRSFSCRFAYDSTVSGDLYVSLSKQTESIASEFFEIDSTNYRFKIADLGYSNKKINFKVQLIPNNVPDDKDYFKGCKLQLISSRELGISINETFTKSNGTYTTPIINLPVNRSESYSNLTQSLTIKFNYNHYKFESNNDQRDISYAGMKSQVLSYLNNSHMINGGIIYSSNNTNIGGSSCQISDITKWLVNGVQMTTSEISNKPQAFFAQDISIYPYSYTAIFSLEAPRTVNNVTLTYNVENAETGKLETKTVTAAKPFSHYLLNGNVVKAGQSTSCVINQKFVNEITIPVTPVYSDASVTLLNIETPYQYTVSFLADGKSLNPIKTKRTFLEWTGAGKAGANYSFADSKSLSPTYSNENIIMPSVTKNATITYNGNGGTPSKKSESSSYQFKNWKENSSNVTMQANKSYKPTKDTSFVAQWGDINSVTLPTASKSGTIKFNANGGKCNTASKNTVFKATKWNKNGISVGNVGSSYIPKNASEELTAVYEKSEKVTLPSANKTSQVRYDANGADNVEKVFDTANFALKEWRNNSVSVGKDSYAASSTDETLTAVYNNESDPIVLPNASKKGYTFKGWSDGKNVYGDRVVYKANINDADPVLSAEFIANTYSIHYDANGGVGNMNNQTIHYDETTSLTKNTFTKENYKFVGWSLTSDGDVLYQDEDEITNLTSENGKVITLYAIYKPITYTVKFENKLSQKPSSETVQKGSEIDLPKLSESFAVQFDVTNGKLANASTSQTVNPEFKGWSKSEDGSTLDYPYKEDFTAVNIPEEISEDNDTVTTLYAVWDYTNCNVVLPEVIADEEFEFKNWKINDNEYNSNETISVKQNTICTARIEKKVLPSPDPIVPTPKPSESPKPSQGPSSTDGPNKPSDPTPSGVPSSQPTDDNNKSLEDQIKDLMDLISKMNSSKDMTESQITELIKVIKNLYGMDDSVAKSLIDFINGSSLPEDTKLTLIKALTQGYVSDDLKNLLLDAIRNSSLSTSEKEKLIHAINNLPSISLEDQKKLLNSLQQGSSVTYKIDGVEYLLKKNANGALTIGIKNLGNKKIVTIPDAITIAGTTVAVTEIAPNSFKGNNTLKEVYMGNNISKIGNSAFENCKNLKKVQMSNSITSIGSKAFKGCVSLPKIDIPSSVLKIGSSAFENCSKLKTVTFHEGLMNLGNKVFYKCKALTKVKLPKSLIKIGNTCFSKCTKLKTVTFAANSQLYSIGKQLFEGDTSLNKIKIPDNVVAIPEKTFKGCKKLAKVTGLKSVGKIGESAFEGCSSIRKITLSGKVQSISYKAFYKCSKLSTVTIKSKIVTSIDDLAFKKCKKNIKFRVPNNKKSHYKALLNGKY